MRVVYDSLVSSRQRPDWKWQLPDAQFSLLAAAVVLQSFLSCSSREFPFHPFPFVYVPDISPGQGPNIKCSPW